VADEGNPLKLKADAVISMVKSGRDCDQEAKIAPLSGE